LIARKKRAKKVQGDALDFLVAEKVIAREGPGPKKEKKGDISGGFLIGKGKRS